VRIESPSDIPLLDPLLRWTLPAIALAGILAARFFPFEAIPPLCPLRRIASLPCLGCGGTRAWIDMAHLRILDAFIQNPLGAISFLAALVMVCYQITRTLGWMPALRLHTSPREGLWLRVLFLAALALNWLYLIISGVAT
jgi:hypothetical protein